MHLAKDQGIKLHPSLLSCDNRMRWYWAIHHHHYLPVEQQSYGSILDRTLCILREKPKHQRKVRLEAMRLVKDQASVRAIIDGMRGPKKRLSDSRDLMVRAIHSILPSYFGPQACDFSLCGRLIGKAYTLARSHIQKNCERKLLAQWDGEYPNHPQWTSKRGLKFSRK